MFFYLVSDVGDYDYDGMENGSTTSRARLKNNGDGKTGGGYAESASSEISAGPEKWRRVRRGTAPFGTVSYNLALCQCFAGERSRAILYFSPRYLFRRVSPPTSSGPFPNLVAYAPLRLGLT